MRDNFTDSEINHICEINRQLINLQSWLNTRTELALKYCEPDNETSKKDFDDYEMETFFKFSLGESDEGFDAENEYDNRISVISWRAKSILDFKSKMDGDGHSWNECIPMIGKLKDTRFCYLFHDLFEHRLLYDWNAVLRIGDMAVEHVLTIQREMYFDDISLPEGYSKRSISLPHSYDSYRPHALDELFYIQLLHKNVKDAERWIHKQIRRMECAYFDDWRHKGSMDLPNTHEDHALFMRTDCRLSEQHSDYIPNDDNILLSVRELLPRKDEFIFGSPRNPMQSEEFWHLHEDGAFFNYSHHCNENNISSLHNEERRFCKLFHTIHDGLYNDWRRTLCIGSLWLDVLLNQRCFVRI